MPILFVSFFSLSFIYGYRLLARVHRESVTELSAVTRTHPRSPLSLGGKPRAIYITKWRSQEGKVPARTGVSASPIATAVLQFDLPRVPSWPGGPSAPVKVPPRGRRALRHGNGLSCPSERLWLSLLIMIFSSNLSYNFSAWDYKYKTGDLKCKYTYTFFSLICQFIIILIIIINTLLLMRFHFARIYTLY